MSVIDVSNLTFGYESNADLIFRDVSFQMDTDWKLGFIGRNGRGKTTFLHLLMKKHDYRGTISSSVSFEYFPFEVKKPEKKTIDVVRSVHQHFEDWELKKELSLLQVSQDVLESPFHLLSLGEQSKVLIATLFLKEHSFLLLDEPTNHLDLAGRKILIKYLKTKKGFLVVSHDRAFLDQVIDHILSIDRTKIVVQKGNFSTWYQNKEREDQSEIAKNEKLQKEIQKLTLAAKQTSIWSEEVEKSKRGTRVSGLRPDRGHIGHKAAKMMKRSKVLETRQNMAISEKSLLLKNIERKDSLELRPLSYSAPCLVDFRDLSLSFGVKNIFSNLHFLIETSDRIALCGNNGSGKSSIIKILLGEDLPYTGEIYKRKDLIISYVPQETSFLQGSLKAFIHRNQINETLFKAFLRKLDFDRSQFDKSLEDYSEGQKKKVLLAKSLSESAHLYIWDEPLNFIDVISRIQIEELIIKYQPTMLFVEHDSSFSQKISTKKIFL